MASLMLIVFILCMRSIDLVEAAALADLIFQPHVQSHCSAGIEHCPKHCNCSTEQVVVSCSQRGLHQLPSPLPLNMESFLFDNNNITSLPDRAFQGCSNLRHLDLSSNLITSFGNSSFAELDKLQTLLLNNNSVNFNTVSSGLWENMTQLLNLSIQDNCSPVNCLPDHGITYNDRLFAPLTNLQYLAMDGLHNATFGQGFSGLRSLKYLSLFGEFRYITNDTFMHFNESILQTLVVKSRLLTDIEALAFVHFRHLSTLDLSFNPLLGFINVSKAWYGLHNTNISEISLTRSTPYNYDIIQIDGCFLLDLQHTKLKKLVLDANNIVTIDAFFSLFTPKLTYLSLAYNRLVQIMGLMLDIFLLLHLEIVDVSFQSRRLLDNGVDDLPDRSKVNATGNPNCNLPLDRLVTSIAYVPKVDSAKTAVKEFPMLSWKETQLYLPDLIDNQSLIQQLLIHGQLLVEGVGYISKTVPLPTGEVFILSPPRIQEFNASASLTVESDSLPRVTLLGRNNLLLFDYSRNIVRKVVEPIIISSPPPNKITLDFSQNECWLIDPNCFNVSGHCIGTLYLGQNNLGPQLAGDNGALLQYLPELMKLDLSSNSIKFVGFNTFIYQTKLQYLDLKYNSLRLINFKFSHMTSLSYLDLSGNLLDQLDSMTRSVMDQLASDESLNFTTDLLENPLQCSCNTLAFLTWVTHSHVRLNNWEGYVCMFNEKLFNFTQLKTVILPNLEIECHSKAWLIAASTNLAGLGILLGIAFILYTYRFEIKYRCLLCCRPHVPQLPDNHEYDAFIAFEQRDKSWVDEHLIPSLDSQSGEGEFKLLIHHRDFPPGEQIMDNIMRGILNSRKIVLVISQHFVDSYWCEFELRMSRERCFDEGKELIIAILLEETLPAKLSKTLRMLLNSNTYLKWPDDPKEIPNFWRNLKKALGAKHSRIITCQCGKTMNLEN